jgi:outer membrane receptor protein involved in Fe transport
MRPAFITAAMILTALAGATASAVEEPVASDAGTAADAGVPDAGGLSGDSGPSDVGADTGPVEQSSAPQVSAEPLPAPVNFRGVVKERGTRSPLPLMNVVLEECDSAGKPVKDGATVETTTDDNGAFEFKGLKIGRYKVTVAAADFYKFETVDEVSEGKVTEVVYYARRLTYTKFETVVKGKKERKEVAKRTLDIQEIKKLPGTGGDALRAVQDMPGIARTPLNTGGLIVRGSAPKDTRVYIDSVPMPLLFHFMGLTSTYNSELLESLEFLPGGFSAKYGDATAGIVELKTRKPKTDRYHGYIDINLYEASAMVEGPIAEGHSFYAAARRSYIDAVMSKVAEMFGGFNLTMAPWYYDYQAKYQYVKGRKDEVSVQAYGSSDQMRMIVNKVMDPMATGTFSADQQYHRVAAVWTHREKNLTSALTLSPGYTYGRGAIFSLATIEVGVIYLTFREDLSLELSKYLTLNFGMQGGVERIDYTGSTPRNPGAQNQFRPLQNYDIFSWGGVTYNVDPAFYLEGDIKPHERVKLVPGVRIDASSYRNELLVDPRLAIWVKIDDATNIKAQAGIYHCAPPVADVVPGLGNPRLQSEGSRQYSIGFDRKLWEYLNIDFQIFYKDMFNLGTRTDQTITVNGKIEPILYSNEAIGRAYGAELLVRHDVSKYFFGWLAYTIMKSERKENSKSKWALTMFDQTHILTLLGVVRLPKDWDIGVRFRLVSGNPYTPLDNGSYFDADYGNYWPIVGGYNSGRNPLFHQLDIRVDKKFVFDKWILDAYLDIQNVYNYRSIEGQMYNYDYTKMLYVQGLPIIPSLGLRAEF